MDDKFDLSHLIGHAASLSAIAGSFFGVLPAIAAVIATIWYALQIYESTTFQGWLSKVSVNFRKRRVAKLRKRHEEITRALKDLDG